MKTHILIISKTFPKTHPRSGQPTEFWSKIQLRNKRTTIRSNYHGWKKRIDEVNNGSAIISLREWESIPYNSPQIELRRYSKGMISVSKLDVITHDYYEINDRHISTDTIAKNDGLSTQDFNAWFCNVKDGAEMAVISFDTDDVYKQRIFKN